MINKGFSPHTALMASFPPMNVSGNVFFSSALLLLLAFPFSGAQTQSQKVQALYVLGDSAVDVGNNNYLPKSSIKANYPYNGIDYPGGIPTGRFCNGKNIADFVADNLGLPSPPAYLAQPFDVLLKGVNFASGGAGVLSTTYAPDQRLSLKDQIGLFRKVTLRLATVLGSAATKQHLSQSIFLVVIGSNDALQYVADLGSYISKGIIPQRYITLTITTLRGQLKELYGLGARKFLVLGLGKACQPALRSLVPNNDCIVIPFFDFSMEYNKVLTQMLTQLSKELQPAPFKYSYFDMYTMFDDTLQNAAAYGFTETKAACCGQGNLSAQGDCTPSASFCSDRSAYIFWDRYHFSEAAARLFVDKLFAGSYVSPITIKQLIAI